MNCTEFKELIVDYLTKKALDINTKRKFEEHYFECDDCFNDIELTSVTIGVIHSEGIDKILQFSTEDRNTLIKEKANLLVERIKKLISDTSLPCRCYGFETVRSYSHKENAYNINDSIVISIEAPKERDGYLTVLDYDEELNLRFIFPNNANDSTYIERAAEKKIGIKLTGPKGKHNIKAIWTTSKLLQPKKINFNKTSEVMVAINYILNALENYDKDSWIEEVLKYEIIED